MRVEIDLSELQSVVDNIQHDLDFLKGLINDPEFERCVREIVARDEASTFSTHGGNLGTDWGPYAASSDRAGQPVTLIRTGALHRSLTIGQNLNLYIADDAMYISSEVPYAKYVDANYTLVALSDGSLGEIDALVKRLLIQHGRLNWR